MKRKWRCTETFYDIYGLCEEGTTIRIKSLKTGNIVITVEKEAIDCDMIVDKLLYLKIVGIRAINNDVIIMTVDDLDEEGEE